MWIRLLAGALLLTACTTPAPGPVATSTKGQQSSPVPWPSTLPVGPVDFNCKLPVWSSEGARVNDAFIQFAAGTRSPAGEGGYYYDEVVARWLPVRRDAVSPDGRRYAYTEGWSAGPAGAPRVHIADAATGADIRVAQMPEAQPFGVTAFTTTGVYLVIAYEGVVPGVWRADPDTGKVTKVSDGLYEPAGAAWLGVIDPRDPKPFESPGYGFRSPNRIDRRDDTGAMTTWFYKPGFAVSWIAFDGSPALLVRTVHQDVSAREFGEDYWLVDAPGSATKLAGHSVQTMYPYYDLQAGFGAGVADSHGIWIGGQKALYLIRRNGAIMQVFEGWVYPANGCR